MNKYLLIVIAVLVAAIAVLTRQVKKLHTEASRQTGNVEALMDTVRTYKFRDSLSSASVASLQFNVKELKKYRAEDARLISDLKLRPKDVQYITKTVTRTRDSIVYVPQPDGCFHFKSHWLQIDACAPDSNMVVQSRDSIAQVIHVNYRHRFLWWRWGVKSIRQEVVNFNPRSKIGYSEIVKVEK